jgi:hypothetical protein
MTPPTGTAAAAPQSGTGTHAAAATPVASHPVGSTVAPTPVPVSGASDLAIEICDPAGVALTSVQDWVVGRKVRLQVLSRPRGTPLDHIEWTIPGHTVGSYTRTRASAAWRPIASRTAADVAFYWIDGAFGGAVQEVRVTASANGRSMTASARFRVFKPRVSSFNLTTSGRVILDTVRDQGFHVVTMHCEGGGGVPGMRGTASVTAPPGVSGEIGVTQLIDLNRYLVDGTGARFNEASSHGHFVLDDIFGIIYDKRRGSTSADGDSGVPISDGSLPAGMYEDSPQVYLCTVPSLRNGTPMLALRPVASGHGSDRFKCYLMFKPAFPDAIWVTLSYAEWSWNGTWEAARHLSGGYANQDPVVVGHTSRSATGRESHALPTWSGRAEPLFGRG